MTTATVKFAPAGARALTAALAVMLICGNWTFGQVPDDRPKPPTMPPAHRPASPRPRMPSLEQLLDRALDKHPAIVVARARAELAEAELNHTRLEVAREIITLRSNWEAEIRAARLAELQLREQPDNDDLRLALINARAEVAEIEAQLRCLLGQQLHRPADSEVPGKPWASRPPLRGPMTDKIRKALNEPVSLQFIEAPLADVAALLGDQCGVPFIVDGFLRPVPVTLDLREAPLGAVLQAMEDVCPRVRFVVRQYGILVTSKDSATDEEFVLAVDFWKEAVQGRDRAKAAPKGGKPAR